MRVVLDTNVLISALLTPGRAADAVMQMCLKGEHTMVVNETIVSEYHEVMSRPKFAFPAHKVDIILKGLAHHSLIVIGRRCNEFFPDESDRVFYETAITAKAILITGNSRHYPNSSRVMTPTGFLSQHLTGN